LTRNNSSPRQRRPASRLSSSGSPGPFLDLPAATALAGERLAGLPARDVELFLIRLARWWTDLSSAWLNVYGSHPRGAESLVRLVELLADRYRERPAPLVSLDLQRSVQPDWFQEPSMIGYVCYADRFAGSIAGVAEHLDYLEELDVRYLHLMPLLRSRPGETDGGYAVADYREVDPALGSMDDLERLCEQLRARRMSLCVDLVLNHTAAEHPWAQAAAAGDPGASEMYYIYPDRRQPDRWERTLPEVFPDTAPGNFTQLPDGRWVWTTFNSFQWDLNWSNPRVFIEMLDVLLALADRGVEVFRLDAVAFMWKRLGTNCQNQPEVHDLLQALRAAARITAPAVIFKAEAIVGPDDLVRYLGVGRHHGHVSDMAYHNSLMVQYWSALATRDTRLATQVLRALPRKPANTAWATYIRCHDDIGWAVVDEAAAAVGWDGPSHRGFLSAFYAGRFPGSFSRGEVFQYVPSTGDSRISGTFASLAGLESALEAEDPAQVTAAIERIRLGHALILAWDGLPLLYMGDEIGLLNDWAYLEDPAHRADNRWLHRPRMDWAAAERRHRRGTVEARIHADLRHLIETRRDAPPLHAAVPLELLDGGDPAVFAFRRDHPVGSLVSVSNFADSPRVVPAALLPQSPTGLVVDVLDASRHPVGEDIELPSHGVRWLVASEATSLSGRAAARPKRRRRPAARH
jgi:amylosucrase